MLQTYACKTLFQELNCDFSLIDYYRDHDYREDSLKSLPSYYSFRCKNGDYKGLKGKAIGLAKCAVSYRNVKRFHEICSSFLRKNVGLTQAYYDQNALLQNPPKSDLYVAGSDQIWNTDYNRGVNPAFFLGFAAPNAKKIALASSIGKSSFEEKEREQIKGFLSDFKAISVREDSAQSLLSSIGIPSESIIDPTLMLNAAEWDKLCAERMVEKPYLLIYKLKGDSRLDEIAYKIAAEKKLQVVRISFGRQSGSHGEKVIVLPQIGEFLSLIKHADYVVTNSFHGTCFSINYQRRFLVVTRNNYNTRVENILAKLGLKDRLYRDSMDVSECCAEIDYAEAAGKLEQERTKAKNWLRGAIE